MDETEPAAKRKRPRDPRPLWRQALDLNVMRKLPFWMFACVTLLLAYQAPYGRRPPQFNWDLNWDSILYSAQKPVHIAACALLMVLGVMAYKWKRWWLAALLTMLVGLGWEIAQMTVAGHTPRIADLVPNFLGVVLGFFIVEGLRAALAPDRHIFG
jgi:hypothetical protein